MSDFNDNYELREMKKSRNLLVKNSKRWSKKLKESFMNVWTR